MKTETEKPLVWELDPDFRRDAPAHPIPYCAKCQRKVDTTKANRVWVNWETWSASNDRESVVYSGSGGKVFKHVDGVISEEWIGPDCWKVLMKSPKKAVFPQP
jgi:hypothetical protein